MLDKKYLDTFQMSFLAFEQLVLELTPFLQSHTRYFVQASIPIWKQVKLVIYWLACGHSCEKMNDLYGCGASTIRKCINIVCEVLSSRDQGLFIIYIHTPTRDRLHNIIERFKNSTRLPNICGAIDRIHIPLARRSRSDFIPMASDFFNRKKFLSVVLQGICDMDRIFWNVCARQPGGIHDAGQFQWSYVYHELHQMHILSNSTIVVRGVQVKPYLIGDSAYLSQPYLLKNYKPRNPAFRDQKRFDASINTGKVVIEHAFSALKNRWRILKSFGGNVNKCTTETIVCCILHNYCELHGERLLVPKILGHTADPFACRYQGAQRLPNDGDGAKLAKESMRRALYGAWLASNPST